MGVKEDFIDDLNRPLMNKRKYGPAWKPPEPADEVEKAIKEIQERGEAIIDLMVSMHREELDAITPYLEAMRDAENEILKAIEEINKGETNVKYRKS